MDPLLKTTLMFRIAAPLAGVAVLLGVARARKIALRDDVGIRWPSQKAWPLWLIGWGIWIFAEDFIGKLFGIGIPSDWSGRGPGVLALLAVGMVLLAPLSEELAFRGVIFHQVRHRLGPLAAIVVTGALFALLHIQYGPVEIGLVLVHGLVLGLARQLSGSLLLTFAMHAMGNLYAYAERFPG